MTNTTKALEDKFNKNFPAISSNDLGKAKPSKFNKARFLKAAEELQKAAKGSTDYAPKH